ncbi:hypothetical protein [Limosilactobacillus sp.]|uniref:hypothetical protein n=1 Tax=Limosilactobacillus sp. TaxID=2773925 RepID=UPI002589BB07|nr:hypothetical protein [Limosilactobacillus sp.]MCC6096999.1 hypothetical protein [Limosilactobacillus sp.]
MKKIGKFLLPILAFVSIFIFTASPASAKKFTLDYDTYNAKSIKTYKTNASDSSWSGVNVKVNKIQVVKLAKKYKYNSANDGKFKINGFIRLHYVIQTGSKDVNIYPTQGTYSFSNGEQHQADSLENWDGSISSHVKKSGWVSIPVQKVSGVNSVRAKFDANYDTDNADDDNQYHTYDMNINF